MSSSIYPRRPILRSDKWNRENNPYLPGTSAYHRWAADFHLTQASLWSETFLVMIGISLICGVAVVLLRTI